MNCDPFQSLKVTSSLQLGSGEITHVKTCNSNLLNLDVLTVIKMFFFFWGGVKREAKILTPLNDTKW